MSIKLYLDEDVDPLLAQVLRDRGVDCLSTQEADRLGLSDADQLAFAINEGRAILTFNVKDFVRLAREYHDSGRHHQGIIVSNHLVFRELLRRVLSMLVAHAPSGLANQLLWLQDYKKSEQES